MKPAYERISDLIIDGERVSADLAHLAEFGRAPGGGWTRPALTPADAAARCYMIGRMRETGLDVVRDEVGNVRARLAGREPSLAPVMSGSHLDSVPSGGKLDGPLGVVGAVAALAAIRAAGIVPRRPIEAAIFVGEEGSRFPRGTIGSVALSGEVSVHDILALRDADGVRFADALGTYGDDELFGTAAPIPARVAPGDIHAFVELHIEQGGVLESEGLSIGAVTAINGLIQRRVVFTGDPNHAGATPMHLRRDAFLGAAEWALGIERAARALGQGAVATVGKIEVLPGGKNIIPGRVEAICDLRAPSAEVLDELDRRIVEELGAAAERRGLTVTHERLQRVSPARMDERCIAAVEAAAERAGLRSRRLPSGAIHDALHMADVAPSTMVFVPSIGGKSHCPEEDTAPRHLVEGIGVLAYTLAALAES